AAGTSIQARTGIQTSCHPHGSTPNGPPDATPDPAMITNPHPEGRKTHLEGLAVGMKAIE
ncbi:hypothetical protein, partial [Phytoactinopolyspora alkaliphila]|uniref:hypothetical protein n=1 Tax=Phytoactinopolyspora alkaliphila TaxID=1783498 RepID=UPI001C206304